jgi:hypothetical protein
MPKLNTATAKAVDSAEDGFKPVPDGVYIVQLMEDVDVKEGAKGPYWRWTFEVPKEHEGVEQEFAGRRFWTNTSLSEQAYFMLKKTFEAFGVPVDTDTEDLVGRRVKAMVTIKTINGGARQGQLGNEIGNLLPLNTEVEDAAASATASATKGGKSDDEPMF